MSVLTVTAQRIIREFPSGSIQRINMIRVVAMAKLRFIHVKITLEAFQDPMIPRLKDKAIQNLLHKECDADRKKSLEYIKREIMELEEIKKELEK